MKEPYGMKIYQMEMYMLEKFYIGIRGKWL